MQQPIEVGVLGATGMVGQHFVKFLEGHPWFRLTWLGASDRSAGKKYCEATSWRLGGTMPESVADRIVEECTPGNAPKLVFSATDSNAATQIEQAFAKAGHVVVSNSKNHRMDDDVSLLIPEINPDHLKIAAEQQRRRGWPGQIVTNPNCSTVVLALALAPLKPFGIKRVIVTTMQAISGAGYPGVSAMDITANVVPYIGGEEDKVETEAQKILGEFTGSGFKPYPMQVSAHCNRVPVVDGHLAAVSVELASQPNEADLIAAFENYRSVPQERKLPSAPERPVIYMREQDRPQPRRDVEREHGMTVFVGRVRPCPVFNWKFMALGHNTVRGAAGAAVLNAELMLTEGML